jgi:hypothetical protein
MQSNFGIKNTVSIQVIRADKLKYQKPNKLCTQKIRTRSDLTAPRITIEYTHMGWCNCQRTIKFDKSQPHVSAFSTSQDPKV